jgi:hypothetical protein
VWLFVGGILIVGIVWLFLAIVDDSHVSPGESPVTVPSPQWHY